MLLALVIAVFLAHLHGPVTPGSLAVAVANETKGTTLFSSPVCVRTAGAWECSEADREASSTAMYRVRVRPGSSCFDATLAFGEAYDMPRKTSGCVRRWQ